MTQNEGAECFADYSAIDKGDRMTAAALQKMIHDTLHVLRNPKWNTDADVERAQDWAAHFIERAVRIIRAADDMRETCGAGVISFDSNEVSRRRSVYDAERANI